MTTRTQVFNSKVLNNGVLRLMRSHYIWQQPYNIYSRTTIAAKHAINTQPLLLFTNHRGGESQEQRE